MLPRLGIAEAVAGKSRMIPAEPVGAVVARGEAEIGFQQISELKPIAGIDLVGPLPPAVQKFTLFSAAVVVGSREPEGARKLMEFLASSAAAPAIRDSGMKPIAAGAKQVGPFNRPVRASSSAAWMALEDASAGVLIAAEGASSPSPSSPPAFRWSLVDLGRLMTRSTRDTGLSGGRVEA